MSKILIVDDSKTAQSIVQRCLEILGGGKFSFLTACNGQEAIDVLRREPVDLIITDLNMPIMDGKKLAATVKASPKMNHIPLFVVTSLGNPALEAELRQIGTDAVIFKPFSPNSLREPLEKIFGKDF